MCFELIYTRWWTQSKKANCIYFGNKTTTTVPAQQKYRAQVNVDLRNLDCRWDCCSGHIESVPHRKYKTKQSNSKEKLCCWHQHIESHHLFHSQSIINTFRWTRVTAIDRKTHSELFVFFILRKERNITEAYRNQKQQTKHKLWATEPNQK